MILKEKIIELTKNWYELVSFDHHKDCDCHWYINEVYSYGDINIYRVEHYGYIYSEYTAENFKSFDTHADAEKFLVELLLDAFASEKEWALEVKKSPESYDADQLERADRILKLLEKNKTLNCLMFERKTATKK